MSCGGPNIRSNQPRPIALPGESTNLPEILKMSVLALDPSDSELLVAAQAAAKEVAKAAAIKGRHPALIHKESYHTKGSDFSVQNGQSLRYFGRYNFYNWQFVSNYS